MNWCNELVPATREGGNECRLVGLVAKNLASPLKYILFNDFRIYVRRRPKRFQYLFLSYKSIGVLDQVA